MCGRFAQSQAHEDYLAYLAAEAERDIAYDPAPIGRYNVAPGTKVLLLTVNPCLWRQLAAHHLNVAMGQKVF